MSSQAHSRRIALVGPTHPAPGGIVHFTDGLAAAFAERGPSLVVGWQRRFPERLYPGTITDDVSQTPVSASGEPILDLLDPRTWRRAARRIKAFQTDVAVLQWWHPMHAPVVIALRRSLRRAGIRVVVICHNVEPHETNVVWRGLTRRALRGADALVVHAASVRTDAEALAPGVPVIDAFLPVFGNVADAMAAPSPQTVAALRHRVGARDRKLLLCFGYVRPYKGVADAIAAMAHLHVDATLLVAGECWDGADEYRAAVDAAGVADRVTLDFRYVPNDELPVLFGAADAVILPYRTATQSAVAALAFAFGRPVIATRAGGLAELVEDGVTGALAPPADPAALATAIDRVLDDHRDWTPAIDLTRRRLSWTRYVQLVEDGVGAVPRTRDPQTHAVLDRVSRQAKAAKVIWTLEHEGVLAGARVLDVGTGNGTIAAAIAEHVGAAGKVVSVDVEDVRVDRDGYTFHLLTGDALPFTDASFDVVVSNHVIEHVGDSAAQQRHLGEVARVLAAGGILYLAVPYRWRLVENHYRLPLLSWLPPRLADRYVRSTGRADRYDCRLLARRELVGMLASAGLEARDATNDLIAATIAIDGGLVARALRFPGARHLVRGPAVPTIVAVARKPASA